MLEPAVDGLGGAVGGAGVVEVGQDVLAPALQGSPEPGSSGLGVWSGAQSVSEASGVDEGSGDVVGGVAESLGDAS